RFGEGGLVQGGVSVGRIATNFCGALVGHPEVVGFSIYNGITDGAYLNLGQVSRTEPFCNIVAPYEANLKLVGVYPLPWWKLQTSASLQSLVYPQEPQNAFPGILAIRAYSTAEIQPSLGRPLTGGIRSLNLNIVPPGTMYGDRIYQLDLRVTRTFQLRNGGKIQPQLDLYN